MQREDTIFISLCHFHLVMNIKALFATLRVRCISDYHVFLIASLVITRLLVDEFYHLKEFLFQ